MAESPRMPVRSGTGRSVLSCIGCSLSSVVGDVDLPKFLAPPAEDLYALSDTAAALPLYRRALESRERVLGKEHPQTLSSVNNLALCLYALGDAAAALPLLRRALDSS